MLRLALVAALTALIVTAPAEAVKTRITFEGDYYGAGPVSGQLIYDTTRRTSFGFDQSIGTTVYRDNIDDFSVSGPISFVDPSFYSYSSAYILNNALRFDLQGPRGWVSSWGASLYVPLSFSYILDNGLPTITSTVTGVGAGLTTYAGATYGSGGNGSSLGNLRFTISPFNSAIPEPATWTMMIGGFAVAASVLRTRRRVGELAPA